MMKRTYGRVELHSAVFAENDAGDVFAFIFYAGAFVQIIVNFWVGQSVIYRLGEPLFCLRIHISLKE